LKANEGVIMIDQEYLKECFDYNKDTGDITWLTRPLHHFVNLAAMNSSNSKFAGKVAGSIMNRGYMLVGINGTRILYHRIILMLMGLDVTGKQVDHINGDKTDNRWANLRLVDQIDNLKNKSLRTSNKTGISGVSFYSNLKGKPFRVTYYEDGNKRATEFFVPTLFEAACARKSFEYKNGYHDNHGRKSTTSK
jgi:hypothetical protein